MAIKHNTYYDGRVQSLSFQDSSGTEISVGVMEPGEHNFGVAQRRETIFLTHGILIWKGEGFSPNNNEPITIEAGEDVVFSCSSQVAYFCLYG